MPRDLCYDIDMYLSRGCLLIVALSILLGALAAGGCGYAFQRSQNPVLEEKGVRRIFVAPLVNNTYKAGVENLVYNEVVRKIAAYRGVNIVGRKEDADAVLKGFVEQAIYGPAGTTSASQLFGNDKLPLERRGSDSIRVATVYSASLGCSFQLERSKPREGMPGMETPDGALLWSGSFSGSQSFPGSNQIDVFGTTSALINESEFDRALKVLAEGVVADLYESMCVMF